MLQHPEIKPVYQRWILATMKINLKIIMNTGNSVVKFFTGAKSLQSLDLVRFIIMDFDINGK